MVSTMNGNTFVVSDGSGDVQASPSHPVGLFSFDTRFLSRWVLTIDGQRLNPLSKDDLEHFETKFFLVPGEVSPYLDPDVSVIRARCLSEDFTERLTIINHSHQPRTLSLRLDVASDFADLFEVKDAQPKSGQITAVVDRRGIRLRYTRRAFHREAYVSCSDVQQVDETGFSFEVALESSGLWEVDFRVETLIHGAHGRDLRESLAPRRRRTRPADLRGELSQWLDRAPHLACDEDRLERMYWRSLTDLAALRYSPLSATDKLPCAGLPWFMTMFGRDSIFVSLQSLPYVPEIAAPTLRTLAQMQGTVLDDFRDEEPGKIMHELRYGESSGFEQQPHSPYYGSADATPLFVVLLDEYSRWTGDTEIVRELEPDARGALAWIDAWSDLQGNGYVSYQRRNTVNGLENQCWKDSPDSVSYRDGSMPGVPRATCELQGYAFDAKKRGARLAREVWGDADYASRLEREAADLKARFNRDFWVEEREHFALALDADGRQVDALSSNMGHLLWSGIADDDKAARVARHLLSPELFSGWGVRTLGMREGRYNPVGYHVGAVWPFDNSIIAAGLARYGFRDEAARIAIGMIAASEFFAGRLPEAIAGYDRELTRYPVEYPTACSPQAWSSGACLLLITTMLGLEVHGDRLVTDPVLPEEITRVELTEVLGRWGRADAFARGRTAPRREPPRRRP
ncbi:amylo-alpha-1,6-glucosidase [Micromonospora fulviviridis]|uniref:Glycogen debranching N-terminal domain-containing protein n=1 Tax=Micromonospora fulviviridis TaxID=47860 RepID=A0ABV2VW00_9ACTN